MYNFKEITAQNNESFLNSEALFLYDKSDFVENLIQGFRTVSVDNYNALKREVMGLSRNYGNGSTFVASRFPAKEIKVEFQLHANTVEELTRKQMQLARLLYKEQLKFTFNNLLEWYYIGTVTEIEYDKGVLSPAGTITIFCADPFKYSNEVIELNANEQLTKDLGFEEFYHPFELEIFADSSSLLNDRTYFSTPSSTLYFLGLKLNNPVHYVFNFETGELKVNDVVRNDLIDIKSEVSTWGLRTGERFEIPNLIGVKKCVAKFRRKEVA